MATTISNEDFQFYIANKRKLTDALKNKGLVIESYNAQNHVGLLNQGATCYLNSLLQCLYNDYAFRQAIYDTHAAGPAANAEIIAELATLFANMQASHASAISTQPLSMAFGWERSQIFEQHDVHELLSVLIDALGNGSPELQGKLNALFQGSIKDVLTCPTCGHKSANASPFLCLSVDLPDNLEAVDLEEGGVLSNSPGILLTNLLQAITNPEVLDADNMWNCSGCNTRVQATKAQEVDSLPSRLFLHLKRFRFDPTTRRRRKLTTSVLFPQELDAAALLKCTGATATASSGTYRLSTVLLHNGTALGGHYRAYTRNNNNNSNNTRWRECNDAVVQSLTPQEEENLFWFNPAAVDINTDQQEKQFRKGLYESAYMLVYERVSSSNPAAAEAVIPPALLSAINSQNVELQQLRTLHNVQRQLVELTVHVQPPHHNKFQSQLDSSAAAADGGEGGVEGGVLDPTAPKKVVCYLLNTHSLNDALTHTLAELATTHPSLRDLFGDTTSPDAIRLRRYNAGNNRVGETFGGREGTTLSELGLAPAATLLLETRTAKDPAFVEFNPREMQVRLLLWGDNNNTNNNINSSNSTSSPSKSQRQSSGGGNVVTVPGEEGATVGALRQAASAVFPPAAGGKMVLILNTDTTVTELTDDTKCLKKDYGVHPGDEIIVDLVTAPEGESSALTELRNRKQSITLFYNQPTSSGDSNDNPAYISSVVTTLDTTLAAVKEMIAQTLGGGLTAESFHTKRNAAAPQLKDESKTLKDLGFVDQSILHLQLGAGCKLGEHLLKFELDMDTSTDLSSATNIAAASSGEDGGAPGGGSGVSELISLGEIAVREKMTVLQLKELLLQKWNALVACVKRDTGSDGALALPKAPPTADYVRLRDGKSSQASGPLRNDRVLNRCLLGLQDGRRIVVQILSAPEVVGPDDLVLSIRLASYDSKTLSRVFDIPLPRSTTVAQLYKHLFERVPESMKEEPPAGATTEGGDMDAGSGGGASAGSGGGGDAVGSATDDGVTAAAGASDTPDTPPAPESKYISIAKAFSTGPPVTLKSALKLKWNDPAVLSRGLAPIDHPPLNLRDGSVLLIRGAADFERAKAAVKARREAEGPRPASAGTGAAAAKARRPGSRGVGTGRYPSSLPKEKGLKIGNSNTYTSSSQPNTPTATANDSIENIANMSNTAPPPPVSPQKSAAGAGAGADGGEAGTDQVTGGALDLGISGQRIVPTAP